MEGSGVRIEEGTIRQTYVGEAWKRAMAKYSVEFEVNSKRYSAWFNPQDDVFYSDCPASIIARKCSQRNLRTVSESRCGFGWRIICSSSATNSQRPSLCGGCVTG
jgi:hypothetical protein